MRALLSRDYKYSDNHCNYTGKHIKDFKLEDWIWYYREHGVVPKTAEIMARSRIREIQEGKIKYDEGEERYCYV